MAVRVATIGRRRGATGPVKGADIRYVVDGRVQTAVKLPPSSWDESHRRVLLTATLSPQRELVFGVPGWRSCWIGAGEEKAVFLVIDPQDRAFAVEVLARGSYLQGHLAEGHYLDELYLPGLSNVRWDERSLCGHVFSGQVKVREFIFGTTLAGPGLRQAPAVRPSWLARLIGGISHAWAAWVVYPRYHRMRRRYRDAHEANVMIEVMPISNPEKKSHYLLPIPWLEEDGRLHLRHYRLTPIDVRAR